MDADHLSPDDDRLAEKVGCAESGESIAIARDGTVVARRVPAGVRSSFDLAACFGSIEDMPVHLGNRVVAMRRDARC